MSRSAFITQSCERFLTHWQSLRLGNNVPHTSAFFDDAPVEHMPFVFICDFEADGLLIRQMGTGLVDHWRKELTGWLLKDRGVNCRTKGSLKHVHAIYEHPCGMRQIGRTVTSTGMSVHFESITLPLAVDFARPPRVVTYNHFLTNHINGEHATPKRKTALSEWLNLGAGVPNEPLTAGACHVLDSKSLAPRERFSV